jgi:hypothetical protein
LDSNNNPHISYYDSTNGDLRYARWTGSSWSIETVDSTGNVGTSTSLALDSNDKPHISYQDYTNFNLKYAATSNEYFNTVDVIQRDSDGDGYNDAVEVVINADTSYSGTMTVSVYAYLLGPQGYPPVYTNSTSWSITGTAMEHGTVWLYVPPGSPEGLYDVELNLCDDENILEDTDYKVDIYLYPPAQVLEPHIESCNFIGERKDTFDLGETVYVNGSGFSSSTGYSFYLVADQETWTDGMAIPPRVPETETSIPSNADGTLGPLPVWADPQTSGNYDIIIDINNNGQYDAGIDTLDDSDIDVTSGLTVIPEFSSILLLLILAILVSLSAIILKRNG